jgi:hypothetical protein
MNPIYIYIDESAEIVRFRKEKNRKSGIFEVMTFALVWVLLLTAHPVIGAVTILSAAPGREVASFAGQAMPEAVSTILATQAIAPDLVISAFSLRIKVDGPMSSSLLLQLSGGEYTWSAPLEADPEGAWLTCEIPATFDAGWSSGPDRSEAGFVSDLKRITSVQVYALRGGDIAPQVVSVEDLTVHGHFPAPSIDELAGDSDNDGLTDIWEIENGFSRLNAEDAAMDDDGDSMTNLDEFLAGTDPNDEDSALLIDEVIHHSAASGGNVIKWRSAPNRTYSLSCATDLGIGFQKVATAIPSQGAQTTYRDFSDSDACYYRIDLENETLSR